GWSARSDRGAILLRTPAPFVGVAPSRGPAGVTGSLIEDLRGTIGSTGPLPFVDFMRLALYHPRDGDYATRVPRHGSDYRTSPSLSPWFGRLVARQLEAMWEALGTPDPFWVVEVGAGRADLA